MNIFSLYISLENVKIINLQLDFLLLSFLIIMDTGFYRGTNAEQDGRFIDKEKKLLKTMKFEPILDTKV